MSGEIKVITDILNYYKTTQKEPVYCEELITTGELQRLLDYITNLQEENERLNKELSQEKDKNEKVFKIMDEAMTKNMIIGEATINLLEILAILKRK